MYQQIPRQHSYVFAPRVFAPNFLLLLRREVVLDVEVRADLLRRLSLDHVSHGLAGQIQQCFDVQVVSSLSDAFRFRSAELCKSCRAAGTLSSGRAEQG